MNKKQRQLDAATNIANRHGDLHPWHVAVVACNWASKADFDAFLTGMLHDSMEDGYATEGELRSLGIPDDVIAAVMILTRRDGEPYWDYIARVKGGVGNRDVSQLAIKVKLADATVNLARCQENFGYTTLEARYVRVIEELS